MVPVSVTAVSTSDRQKSFICSLFQPPNIAILTSFFIRLFLKVQHVNSFQVLVDEVLLTLASDLWRYR